MQQQQQAAPEPEWHGGEVLFAGGTDWSMLGRSGGKGKKEEQGREEIYPNLLQPHRIKGLMGVKIQFIAAGPAAVHCMAGSVDGKLYVWGRNEKGQLGLGDLNPRNHPTIVPGLSGMKIVAAAGGRHHSTVITDEGDAYSFGLNSQGQCGIGVIKNKGKVEDLIMKPTQVANVSDASSAACGVDFTMWLSKEGQLYASGNPQYGQLGDGSDHAYNAKDSSIQIVYEPQPTPKLISALSGTKITAVACGHNHTLALDDAGACYSWGNGGYGRLGHKVQKDEFTPKKIETFSGRMVIPPGAVLAAGGTASMCTGIGGQMFNWGKLKTSGDNTMYPVPNYDLQGWNVRSMACGAQTFSISADNAVITWGMATNGELGYGPLGKKSSACAAKCEPLGECYCKSVACGVGFNMFLIRDTDACVTSAPIFESSVEDAEGGSAEPSAPAAGGVGRGRGRGKAAAAADEGGSKRKAPGAAAGRGRGKKAKAE